jgi:hypothetical protein
MKFTALVTIGAVSSVAYAQSSKKSAPDGCKESYDGKFSVGVLKAGSAKVCLHPPRVFKPNWPSA